jgi:hypothetical protein
MTIWENDEDGLRHLSNLDVGSGRVIIAKFYMQSIWRGKIMSM